MMENDKMIEKYALFKVFDALKDYNAESIRSLARKAKISPSASKNCLDYLYKEGLLNKEIIGKTHSYKLNNESFLTRHIKLVFSLAEIKKAGLISELITKYPKIISIMLYGSAALGTDDNKSDIDILIISRDKFEIKPLDADQRIDREITVLKYTYNEWKNKAEKDKVFYDKIISEGILLYGEIPMVI